MDDPSQHVVEFLGALQEARTRLSPLWNQLVRRGALPAGGSSLSLSASPYTVHDGASTQRFLGSLATGLTVKGSNGREYELVVELMWDAQGWTVTTEAWVEAEEGGYTLVRELPERKAHDLRSCLEHFRAAVEDLATFADLVP